jgi:hypothetical protein
VLTRDCATIQRPPGAVPWLQFFRCRPPGTKDDAPLDLQAEQIGALNLSFSILDRNVPEDELDAWMVARNGLDS